MEVYGQLQVAGLERLTSNPAGANLFIGRMWFRTDTNKFHVYDGSSILEFADLTSAQTFQQKTLAGATISDFLQFTQQGSTPANPAAGSNRIYFKTDGTAYTLASDGTELPLGSGSGGSKNYFEDADARIDSNVGGWETDDGAGSPSGGLTLSLTAVAGELLEGVNSLKIAKDAADRNGHFVKVLSKTIDPADRGRPNYGSFEFRPLTGYESSDLIWEVYDVTNAAVLYSGQASDLELLNSRGRFNWVTYLDETTEQVEFRLKVNNTNTNAFDVVADEFSFGPVAQLNSPVVTAWETFTPTFNNDGGAIASAIGQKCRVGNTMHVKLSIAFNGAGASGSPFSFNIPDGLNAINGSPGVGPYVIFDRNNNNEHNTSYCQHAGTLVTFIRPNTTGNLTSTEFFSTAYMRADLIIPIEEWSNVTNVVNTNELSQTGMVVSVGRVAPQNFSDGAQQTVLFDTVRLDELGVYDDSTGVVTVAKPGRYKVKSQVMFGGLNVDAGEVRVLITDDAGNSYNFSRNPIDRTTIQTFEASCIVDLPAGGTIRTDVIQSNGAGRATVSSSTFATFMDIEEIPRYTLLGVVKNDEYIEAVPGGSTGTSVGGVFVDVTGAEITLSPGTWDLGYEADVRGRNNTGILNTNICRVQLLDELNNIIPEMQSSFGGVMAPNTDTYHCVTKTKRIVITEEKTYRMQVGCSDNAANGDATVYGNISLSGTLAGIDSTTRLWARRVK